MDPKDNKPSTPSRRAKKEESEYLEGDDVRTAVETESLTDARISRVPSPVTQSPRDAWASVAPTSQPRIVPSTRLSQADRDAQEIASSTRRALESQGRPLLTPRKDRSNSGTRTAVAASPLQSSVRTAAARSPDVRTGVENSGRSARLKEQAQINAQSRSSSASARSSRSAVRTAQDKSTSSAHSKKSRKGNKSGCSTLHTATANYEIDLRQRRSSNTVTGPTTNVSTARTISPAAASRSGRSPARRVAAAPVQQSPYADADYPPLPSEGDPAEQTVDIIDANRAAQMYTPHISRPIFLGTSGVRTAQASSPGRTRTLSERTARGDTSLKTSRSPASKSEKSLRTARLPGQSPVPNSLGSYNTDDRSLSSKKRRAPSKPSRSTQKSQSQSSLSTTSARSYASTKSWATPASQTPGRQNLRSAQKSASATPATVSARSARSDFSSKSSASRGRSGRKTAKTPAKTPLRTAAMFSSSAPRSPAELTCISPDAVSSLRSPSRPTGAMEIRPVTPDTPRGWPYRASDQAQQQQTSVRVAPSANGLRTAAAAGSPPQLRTAKSPALRSQKELHREAKSSSSKSGRASRHSNNPTSNVSTARTMPSRASRASDRSAKELHSSKTNKRTFSATTIKAGKRDSSPAIDDGPDMVIETVQAHGNIEIDLCFNFRVRAPPGQGFGETSSPLKPKEVLINGKPIWRKD